MCSCRPLPKLLVDEAIGESLAADANALQHSIAAELKQYELSINESCTLHLIGDDAADKVWRCVAEGGHETVQGLLVQLSHCHKLSACRMNVWG